MCHRHIIASFLLPRQPCASLPRHWPRRPWRPPQLSRWSRHRRRRYHLRLQRQLQPRDSWRYHPWRSARLLEQKDGHSCKIAILSNVCIRLFVSVTDCQLLVKRWITTPIRLNHPWWLHRYRKASPSRDSSGVPRAAASVTDSLSRPRITWK